MKCPKCGKKMCEYADGTMLKREEGYYRCSNKKCWFFGIERLDPSKI